MTAALPLPWQAEHNPPIFGSIPLPSQTKQLRGSVSSSAMTCPFVLLYDALFREPRLTNRFVTKADIAALEQRFTALIETQALRLTVRVGVMLAAGLSLVIAILGMLIKFH
jgi:hypothetical protein